MDSWSFSMRKALGVLHFHQLYGHQTMLPSWQVSAIRKAFGANSIQHLLQIHGKEKHQGWKYFLWKKTVNIHNNTIRYFTYLTLYIYIYIYPRNYVYYKKFLFGVEQLIFSFFFSPLYTIYVDIKYGDRKGRYSEKKYIGMKKNFKVIQEDREQYPIFFFFFFFFELVKTCIN